MQITVGECHPKKIKCMLGALQSAFRKPAFLPKDVSLSTMTCAMHGKRRPLVTDELVEFEEITG